MSVITLWSESGGVGKTTTTINLAASLEKQNKNVLIIDIDPQPAGLTQYAGKKNEIEEMKFLKSLLNDSASLQDCIIKQKDTYDVIPSDSSLANIESLIQTKNISMGEFLLKQKLKEIKSSYDFILIDSPATLNILVDNALIASDYVLIPMEMTEKGRKSITGVLETVESLESQIQRAKPEFKIDVLGVLPNKIENTKINKEIITDLQQLESINIIQDGIPNYNVMNKSWEKNLDIYTYEEEYSLQPYQQKIIKAYDELGKYIILETDEQIQTQKVVA